MRCGLTTQMQDAECLYCRDAGDAPLVYPCLCKTGVHDACLRAWLASPCCRDQTRCPQCAATYACAYRRERLFFAYPPRTNGIGLPDDSVTVPSGMIVANVFIMLDSTMTFTKIAMFTQPPSTRKPTTRKAQRAERKERAARREPARAPPRLTASQRAGFSGRGR